jgi:hypothetical protein
MIDFSVIARAGIVVRNAAVITPANANFTGDIIYTALWVGTGGDIAVLHTDDTTSVVYKNVPSGSLLPFAVKQVLSTGTTATDIVGLNKQRPSK